MSEHQFPAGPSRPPASSLRSVLRLAAGIAMVGAGAATAAFAAQTGALLFARWIDLGSAADRLAFAGAMALIGGMAGTG